MSKVRSKNVATATVLWTVVAGMVGLSFASVPLYRLFCQVTGLGGTPQIRDATSVQAVSDEIVTVRFDSNVDPSLPWRFKPLQHDVKIKLGEEKLAFYQATNLSDKPITGTAVFNVTPFKAGPYFAKIDCFCFTEQTLLPGESVDMPVSFFVDPEIFKDINTKDVHTITLSYTFYQAEPEKKDKQVSATKGKAPQGQVN